MKITTACKLLSVVAAFSIVGFVSCNNESKTESTTDTTTVVTPAAPDTSTKMAPDTVRNEEDTTKGIKNPG